jgi:hypothetical protein
MDRCLELRELQRGDHEWVIRRPDDERVGVPIQRLGEAVLLRRVDQPEVENAPSGGERREATGRAVDGGER